MEPSPLRNASSTRCRSFVRRRRSRRSGAPCSLRMGGSRCASTRSRVALVGPSCGCCDGGWRDPECSRAALLILYTLDLRCTFYGFICCSVLLHNASCSWPATGATRQAQGITPRAPGGSAAAKKRGRDRVPCFHTHIYSRFASPYSHPTVPRCPERVVR